jgi:hypothetical protein
MYAVLHVLAESLASDNLWAALVFLVAIVTMASPRTVGVPYRRMATEETAEHPQMIVT